MHHRGTYARPGLVLGLAPGGAVRGAAYRIAGRRTWDQVYAYLREREQPTETYFSRGSGRAGAPDRTGRRKVPALVFLSDLEATRNGPATSWTWKPRPA